MENGEWRMENGEWRMENGKENFHILHSSLSNRQFVNHAKRTELS